MAETSNDGASTAAGIDLTQFYPIFFEEAGENLQTMEQMLLDLDVAAADDEALNAIFRCAHSVKGGAATFGFQDVAALTHQMEALLDKLRRHELSPTVQMVDLLLAAGDSLRDLLGRHQGSGAAAPDTGDLLASIRSLCAGQAVDSAASRPAVAAAAPAPMAAAAPAADGSRRLAMTVGDLGDLGDPSLVDNLVELFKEIEGLGQIEPLDAGMPADGVRRFKVTTTRSDKDLLDLFTFHAPGQVSWLTALSALLSVPPAVVDRDGPNGRRLDAPKRRFPAQRRAADETDGSSSRRARRQRR